MASVGLYLDLNETVKDSTKVEKVRQRILKRFNIDPNLKHRIDIYRMVPLRSHEEISDSDILVAHIPKSRLDAPTIENLIQTSHTSAVTIDHLTNEVTQLKNRLTQSELIRAEAIQTVDLLRTEFISLLDDVTLKQLESARTPSTSRLSNATVAHSSSRPTNRSKNTTRIGIGNSRN